MNPWDIAAWAGALAVTALCALFIYSVVVTIAKRMKSNTPRK